MPAALGVATQLNALQSQGLVVADFDGNGRDEIVHRVCRSPARTTSRAEHGYTLYDEHTFQQLSLGDKALIKSIPAGGGINVIAAVAPLRP